MRLFTCNFSVPQLRSRAESCSKMHHKCSFLYRHWLVPSISVHSGFLWMLLLLYMMLACLGEPMKIRPKMCTNALGEEGTCMFVWECIKTEGKHLGTCVDGFLFGSCCGHNDAVNSIGHVNEHWTQSSLQTSPVPSSSTDSSQPSSIKWQTRPTTRPTTMTIWQSTPSSITVGSTVTRSTSTTTTTTTTTTPQPTTNFVTISAGFESHLPPNQSPFKPYPNKPWFIIQSNKPLPTSTVRPFNRPQMPFPVKSTTHRPLVVPMTHLDNKWNASGLAPSVAMTTTTVSSISTFSHLNQTSSNASPDKLEPVLVEDNVGKPLSQKSPCGITQVKPKKKVVGGKNSAFGAWPWQVSVRRTSFFGFTSTHRCGGAILSSEWIATAGHCVDDLLLTQIRIRVGEYDFSTTKEPLPFIERGARKKVVHPKYNFFTYENDLALVQLDEPIEFQSHVSPICLPPDSIDLLGKNATVTGWGRLSEGGVLPTVLQEVRVPIVSNDKCKNMFLSAGRHEYIPDIFMCAGFDEGGRDSCQGDSGGPLQVQGDDGRWFLAGIISWGIGCGEPSLPGVCTRITKFKQWILSYIAT